MEFELLKRNSNKTEVIRGAGYVPGVVYSAGQPATEFMISEHDFLTTATTSDRNKVFTTKSDDSALNGLKVVIREVQTEPLKGRLLHIDFVNLADDREVRVSVPVKLSGTPAAVKLGSGFLQQAVYFVDVRCLPKDIPAELELNVSDLKSGDSKLAGEVSCPEGVKLVSSKATALARVISKSKKQQGEGEEGAAPAAAGSAPAEAA